MITTYQAIYPYQVWPNAVQTHERECLLHALALVEEAITSLVPLVQEQYPCSPYNKAYALLTDASEELRDWLKEGTPRDTP